MDGPLAREGGHSGLMKFILQALQAPDEVRCPLVEEQRYHHQR
jgi:hypothetical protein